MNKEHIVQVKRQNHGKEDYISSGTAVQATEDGWLLTLTDDSGENKLGMKMLLSYKDKFKFLKKKG